MGRSYGKGDDYIEPSGTRSIIGNPDDDQLLDLFIDPILDFW